MKLKSKLRSFLQYSGAALLAVNFANAATYYWDTNAAANGFGNASGTWTVPTLNLWSTNTAGTAAPGASITTLNTNTTTDAVNFGNGATSLGAGTITVSGTVAAGNMTFASGSDEIILSGGTINFTAAAVITVSNATNTINSIIAGAATSLNKAGSGTLKLTADSTYAGTTIVSGGVLDLGGGTATGTLASTTFNLNGGAFHFTRSDGATKSFTSTVVNSPASSISVAAGNTLNLGTITRSVGGSVDLTSTGAGILAADTASNVGGIIPGISAGGTWAVANGAGVAISGFPNGSYTLTSVAGTSAVNYTGTDVDVDNSPGALDDGIVAHSLRFNTAGAHTLSLTNANTITTGGILVNGTVGSNLSTITGGTLAGADTKDLVILQDNAAGGLTIASNIINNVGATALTKSGAGLLTLSGNNTYTGGLFINGGEVLLNNLGALNSSVGNENALNFRNGTAGTLTLNGNSVVVRSISGGSSNHIVQNANATAATFTIGNSLNLTSTFGGIIQDGAGAGALTLAKSGTGTLTLNNAANSYSGGTVINEGIVSIAADDRLGDTAGDITFTGNAKLIVTVNNVTLAATRTITVNSGIAVMGDVNINSNPINFTIDGPITGAGGIQLGHYQLGSGITRLTSTSSDFAGALILGTTNTHSFSYSGFTVEAASLDDDVGHGNIIFGRGNGSANNVATFIWSNAATSALVLDNRRIELDTTVEQSIVTNNNTDAARTVTVNTDLLISRAGNKTFTLSGINTGANAFNGDIGDSATPLAVIALNKTAAGTWTISGNNSYTGATTVSGGILKLGSTTALGGGNLAISGNAIIGLAAGNFSRSAGTGAGQYQLNNGGFAAYGANRSVSMGATTNWNTTGLTGTLFLSAADSDATVTISNNISFAGGARTVNVANGSAPVDAILGGALSGGGTFNKTGAGTLRSSSASGSYTAVTNIQAGVLEVSSIAIAGDNSALGAPATNAATGLLIGNGATLRYTGSGHTTDRNFTINGTAAGHAATIEATGAGAVTFTNSASPAYGTNNQTRLLTLGGTSTANNSLAANIANNGSGLVTLNKAGSGTWIVSGTTLYTGPTNVNAGKLFINGDQSASTGAVTVAALATLGGTGIVGGNISIADTGKLEFDISTAPGSHNGLDLGAGKTLDFVNTSTLTINSISGGTTGNYILVTAPGGITGAVPAILNLPAGWTANVTKEAGDTQLVLNVTAIAGGDVTDPTLTSIVDNVTGGPVNIGAPVTYTVTFDEDMNDTSITTADFGNNGTSVASIDSVSETTPGVFSVVVTPTSPGTIVLRINEGAILEDLAGNDLDTTPALLDDTTITVRNAYQTWALTNAISSAPGQDKDGDGVNNAIEFLLGGDVATNDLSKLPEVTMTATNMIVTFERKRSSTDGITGCEVEVGTTLTGWPDSYTVGKDDASSDPEVDVVENSPSGFDTITLTVPKGTDPKKFARLSVTVTE